MSNIKYSRHARMRMVERGISEREVSEAINKGSKSRKGKEIVAAHRHIEVVFKMINKEYYVITVMLRW
jgi:hypothetical protein